MEVRPLPFGLGLLALGVGFASLLGVVPSRVTDALSTPAVVGTLVVLVVVTAVLGGRATLSRTLRGGGGGFPALGTETVVEIPGSKFDAELAGLSATDGADARAGIRDRIEAAALATLAAEMDCSPVRARQHLDDGTWTTDDRAAAFFTTEGGVGQVGVRERLVAVASGDMVFTRRAERAIAELHDRQSDRGPRHEHATERELSATERDDVESNQRDPPDSSAGLIADG